MFHHSKHGLFCILVVKVPVDQNGDVKNNLPAEPPQNLPQHTS